MGNWYPHLAYNFFQACYWSALKSLTPLYEPQFLVKKSVCALIICITQEPRILYSGLSLLPNNTRVLLRGCFVTKTRIFSRALHHDQHATTFQESLPHSLHSRLLLHWSALRAFGRCAMRTVPHTYKYWTLRPSREVLCGLWAFIIAAPDFGRLFEHSRCSS